MSDTVNRFSLNDTISSTDISSSELNVFEYDEIEENQEELASLESLEVLENDKTSSKAPRIIEKIIGGVLLGAAAVFAVGLGVATFGIGSAIIGAVVGTLGVGGTVGVVATGAAYLLGIGALIHCGLSRPSAETMVENGQQSDERVYVNLLDHIDDLKALKHANASSHR